MHDSPQAVISDIRSKGRSLLTWSSSCNAQLVGSLHTLPGLGPGDSMGDEPIAWHGHLDCHVHPRCSSLAVQLGAPRLLVRAECGCSAGARSNSLLAQQTLLKPRQCMDS